MDKETKYIQLKNEIEQIQKELDYRTEVENKAIELISQGEFQKAIEILKRI